MGNRTCAWSPLFPRQPSKYTPLPASPSYFTRALDPPPRRGPSTTDWRRGVGALPRTRPFVWLTGA